VFVIIVMTFINLRGVKESARLLAVPTYFFLFMMGFTLLVGFYKMLTGNLNTVSGVEPIHHDVLEPLTLLLLLRASHQGAPH
jgi:amino acid transporter